MVFRNLFERLEIERELIRETMMNGGQIEEKRGRLSQFREEIQYRYPLSQDLLDGSAFAIRSSTMEPIYSPDAFVPRTREPKKIRRQTPWWDKEYGSADWKMELLPRTNDAAMEFMPPPPPEFRKPRPPEMSRYPNFTWQAMAWVRDLFVGAYRMARSAGATPEKSDDDALNTFRESVSIKISEESTFEDMGEIPSFG